MENEFQDIVRRSGIGATTCTCTECVSMCHRAVCLGTPADIARIILAGHIDKIRETLWAAGAMYGRPESIEMYQLEFNKDLRSCVMLDENDRCTLHDAGLKPTEGKLAGCDRKFYTHLEIPPVLLVAASWLRPENKMLVHAIEVLVTMYELGCTFGDLEREKLQHILNLNYAQHDTKQIDALPDQVVITGDFSARMIHIDGRYLYPKYSQKIDNKSEDFGWGYAGSGPSQLALAFMMYFLPVADALEIYHEFKFKYVALWPQADFEIKFDLRDAISKLLKESA